MGKTPSVEESEFPIGSKDDVKDPKENEKEKEPKDNNNGGSSSNDKVDDNTTTTTDKNTGKEFVIAKIKSNPVYAARLDKPSEIETLNKFANALSNTDDIKSSYLSTDWLKTLDFYKSLDEDPDDEDDKDTDIKGKGKQKAESGSTSTGVFSSKSMASTKDIIDHKTTGVTEEDLTDAQFNQSVEQELKDKIRIKLVVAEVAHSNLKKGFRRLICPVLSRLDLLPQLGMFHSALMIGPWLLEWTNSALCVPRKCVSTAAILSADVLQVSRSSKVEEMVDTLAEVIVDWNTSKQYKDSGGDKAKFGNCQDFVDDVLAKLGIQHTFKGSLAEYLKNLREKGKGSISFQMDSEFREKFRITEKSLTFKTHADLDKFVNKLVNIEPDFENKHKNEWSLLKSFDRAFWMRHFKYSNEKDYEPLLSTPDDVDTDEEDDEEELLELNCPFKDPRETASIRFT